MATANHPSDMPVPQIDGERPAGTDHRQASNAAPRISQHTAIPKFMDYPSVWEQAAFVGFL
jgi:hypothetical protein